MSALRKHTFAHRRVWNRTETKTLLMFALHRKEELKEGYKKKYVYLHLMEDMTGSGVSEIPYTLQEIRNKFKSMKKAYRDSIENIDKNGSYGIEPFKDLLDELYSDEILGNPCESQTIASGVGRQPIEIPFRGSKVGNQTNNLINEDSLATPPGSSASINDAEPTSTLSTYSLNTLFDELITQFLPEEAAQNKTRPKRKLRNESLEEMKLEFKRKKEENRTIREANKERRHMEKELATQKRHEEKMKWHAELLNYLKNK